MWVRVLKSSKSKKEGGKDLKGRRREGGALDGLLGGVGGWVGG